MQFSLTKNESSDIDFALACLMVHAIHFGEFKEWLYYVIEHADDPPHYIFDMLDIELYVDFKPMRIRGWHSEPEFTDDEYDALVGISFQRNINSSEDRISRTQAIAQLQSNPAFFSRVKDFFPFLDLEEVVGPDPDRGW